MENHSGSTQQDLQDIARLFVCPVHPEKEIRSFCYNDNTFGCYDCMEAKPENFRVERVKSTKMALEMIEKLFKQSFCHFHNEIQLFYCFDQEEGRCSKCVATYCQPSGHRYDDIETLFQQKMDEINSLNSQSEDLKVKATELEAAVSEAQEADINRINTQFDAFLERVEKKRRETIERIKERWTTYYTKNGLLFCDKLSEWISDLKTSKMDSKVGLVHSCLDGRLRDTLTSMTKKLAYVEERYASNSLNKELSELSFFSAKEMTSFLPKNLISLDPLDKFGRTVQNSKFGEAEDNSMEVWGEVSFGDEDRQASKMIRFGEDEDSDEFAL